MDYINRFLGVFITQYSLMVPYLAFGLLIAGVLKVFVRASTILNHLGGNSFLSVIKAAIIGVPLPLCSCSVVPTAMSLKNRGASNGSILAFLIATPQTGVESIVATYGMLGPLFAFFRPLAALLSGVLGGIIGTKVKIKDQVDNNQNKKDEKYIGVFNKLKEVLRYGFIELMDDIGLNLLIGIVISGVITIFIPTSFFTFFKDKELLGMLAVLIGAIPLYVCGTASIPIAAALVFKGISPGAAFLFLLAGPATNAATITVIFSKLGRAMGTIYISTIVICSLVLGMFLNWFYSFLGIDPRDSFMKMDHIMEEVSPIMLLGIILFSGALLHSLWRSYIKGSLKRIFKKNKNMVTETIRHYSVSGMTCKNCAKHVQSALESLDLDSVSVNLHDATVGVQGNAIEEDIKNVVEKAGYEITKI